MNTHAHSLADILVQSDEVSERCPKARRRKGGGLIVAGVAVASSCQAVLPAFGFLFVVVGTVITVAAYRGPEEGEEGDEYQERLRLTGDLRALGPACLSLGVGLLVLGLAICLAARRARRQRAAFHCPIHGDFYPISHHHDSSGKVGAVVWPCWRKQVADDEEPDDAVCPHSNRPSFSTSHTPLPSITPSHSTNRLSVGTLAGLGGSQLLLTQLGDRTSTRSLSVSYDVASFPHTRSPSPLTTDPADSDIETPRPPTT